MQSFVVDNHDFIFNDLLGPANGTPLPILASKIFDRVSSADGRRDPNPPPDQRKDPDFENDKYDVFAELVNAIAAAAAIADSLEKYNLLVALVRELDRLGTEAEGQGSIWSRIGYRIAEACLQHHPGQTNLFLLLLLNVPPVDDGTREEEDPESEDFQKVLDVYVIYKFLRNQGARSPINAGIFLYFMYELHQIKPAWAEREWRDFVTGMAHSKRAPLRLIAPDFPTVWEPNNMARRVAHDRARRAGRAVGPGAALIDAIREDNVDAFVAAAGDDFKAQIPFSIYEQLFHFEYRFVVQSNGDLEIELGPTALDAVAILGADNIFNYVMGTPNGPSLLQDAAYALVTGNRTQGGDGRLALAQGDFGVDFGNTLAAAIRMHDNELVSWMLEKHWDGLSANAFDAAFRFANIPAFHILFEHLKDEYREGLQALFAIGEPTLHHLAARANAVWAFKVLLADPPVTEPAGTGDGVVFFNPYARTKNDRTFLHWAAAFGAKEVTRFWARNFGNLGFDALDKYHLNPAHYGYIRGTSDRPDQKQRDSGVATETKPFYKYLLRLTDLDYDVANDPDADNHPDDDS
jgi:hypothetical protein